MLNMATVKRFEELIVWQKARMLNMQIIAISNLPAYERERRLRDQIRGSSGSIMDNIAEGFGRMGNREFVNFLLIANGSAMEVRSQLTRSLDHGYISPVTHDELMSLLDEISRMMFSLIRYLRKNEKTGQRYR